MGIDIVPIAQGLTLTLKVNPFALFTPEQANALFLIIYEVVTGDNPFRHGNIQSRFNDLLTMWNEAWYYPEGDGELPQRKDQ